MCLKFDARRVLGTHRWRVDSPGGMRRELAAGGCELPGEYAAVRRRPSAPGWGARNNNS